MDGHLRYTDSSARVNLAERTSLGPGHARNRFHHEALFYSGDDAFLKGSLPLINDALASEEPVVVAVVNEKIRLLKDALGPDGERVSFQDMRALGRNPARIIPAWHQFLRESASQNRPMLGIGEPIWPGRSPAELAECQRHESLLNLAFDGGVGWRLLCPYDLDGLDDRVIEASQHSHPFIGEDGGSRASNTYMSGDVAPGPFDGTLPRPPIGTAPLAFTDRELGTVRHVLVEWASAFELDPERTEHLVLAATELASNSVRHGGGGGTLRMWREETTLLIEVHDRGHIVEPLVGRISPSPEQPTGRGLWLVNQLCDLVQVRSAATGTVVRAHMHLA